MILSRSRQNPFGVSVEDVTVSASHFARRYGRRLLIEVTLSILSDGHFSCVTEPASEKGEGASLIDAPSP